MSLAVSVSDVSDVAGSSSCCHTVKVITSTDGNENVPLTGTSLELAQAPADFSLDGKERQTLTETRVCK